LAAFIIHEERVVPGRGDIRRSGTRPQRGKEQEQGAELAKIHEGGLRLAVDDDSRVVTTKAFDPGQRGIGVAEFIVRSQPYAIERASVLHGGGDLQSAAEPGL